MDGIGRGGGGASAPVGIVVIGRNEGSRLHDSLAAACAQSEQVVYVDSGSTDASVAHARECGVQVVELDPGRPFTAARARNAGVERLAAAWRDVAFVQFVDGDCTLAAGWIDAGLAEMARAPDVGVVCGRRRERYPDATIYNRICDLEWDTPVGRSDSCGGDSLMRIAAFRDGDGFSAELIAGEEPDLCHRLRRRGWTIQRLPHEMTVHDIAMTTVAQWWQRNRRSGHAGAEAYRRRGHEDRRLLKPLLSNLLWGLPIGWPLWPVLWLRVQRRFGAAYATHIVLGKVPHCAGQFAFWFNSLRSRRTRLMEYK